MGLFGKITSGIGDLIDGAGKYVIPAAEIAGAYFTGNPQLAMDGLSRGYNATTTGKSEDGGTFGGQASQVLSDPSALTYGSGQTSGNPGDTFGMGYETPGGGTTDSSDFWGNILGVGGSSSGSDPTNDTGSIGTGDILKGGVAALGGLMSWQKNREKEKARKEWESNNDDTQNRREATYRQDRDLLMAAMNHYFAKSGFKMPDLSASSAPGAGTTRGLPNEAPLAYPPSPATPQEDDSEDDAVAATGDARTPEQMAKNPQTKAAEAILAKYWKKV